MRDNNGNNYHHYYYNKLDLSLKIPSVSQLIIKLVFGLNQKEISRQTLAILARRCCVDNKMIELLANTTLIQCAASWVIL